jgi:hypothetical protein
MARPRDGMVSPRSTLLGKGTAFSCTERHRKGWASRVFAAQRHGIATSCYTKQRRSLARTGKGWASQRESSFSTAKALPRDAPQCKGMVSPHSAPLGKGDVWIGTVSHCKGRAWQANATQRHGTAVLRSAPISKGKTSRAAAMQRQNIFRESRLAPAFFFQELPMLTAKFRLTFTEECLGTASANPELFKDYIASKRPEGAAPDELEALPPVEEELQKAMTVFARDDAGNPMLWDYQIKGFFKDACGALARIGKVKKEKGKAKDTPAETASGDVTAYKKIIDGLIFVKPRKITLHLPNGGNIGVCERPLRAQTAQGERIALARSETVPAGTWFECAVTLLDARHEGLLEEWMQYGALRGLGQWRNSGKGSFTFERVK